MPASAQLIKGYLPVRLKLGENDETFFYVREHQGRKNNNNNNKQGATLFVANAPIVPGISTKILLQSIFGRYAEIARVSVVPNPRQSQQQDISSSEVCASWSDKVSDPSFLPPIYSEGKYAHVLFESSKTLKKTMNALHEVMNDPRNKKGGLTLERIEIQTLADETVNQYRRNFNKQSGLEESDNEEEERQSGVLAVAQRYRQSCRLLSRAKLIEECNEVMAAYEQAEEKKRQAQEALKEQPDEDGFVTVSYSSGAVTDELEESMAPNSMRRKGNKRSRKKKEATGSSELQDFYRFQRRQNKRRSLEDLRTQFEEDLKKVKRMKETDRYRPF
jgi:ribosomal RNA-processing protein 7